VLVIEQEGKLKQMQQDKSGKSGDKDRAPDKKPIGK
jgi:hypothetical protein